MLLPEKHIKLAESLIGLGSFVIDRLNAPKSIDALWADLQVVNNTNEFPAYHGIDNLMLAVDFLFAIGVVDQNEEGFLKLCA